MTTDEEREELEKRREARMAARVRKGKVFPFDHDGLATKTPETSARHHFGNGPLLKEAIEDLKREENRVDLENLTAQSRFPRESGNPIYPEKTLITLEYRGAKTWG